jgi:DNA-directed RNA polymerase sigma subunit (sigma70/sigma32)
MTKERNKHIACLVLQGRTYDSVGIEYDISRERVYQITRRICERIAPDIAQDYSIRKLRKDCDRLISKIYETDGAE